MIQFNYGFSRWNLFPRLTGGVSFFWKGVSSCLLTLRRCILHGINSGDSTLFWKDRWFNQCAPMYLWETEFCNSQYPNGIMQDLAFLLEEAPLSSNFDSLSFRNRLQALVGEAGDKKWWMLYGEWCLHSKILLQFPK